MPIARRPVCAALIGGLAFPGLLKARPTVTHHPINPSNVSYAEAHLVENPSRLLFVSGQVPADAEGKVPERFEDQARLAWRNVETQLRAGGMGFENLVKATIFLSDRRYRTANYKVRAEILGPLSPALTIIITGIYDEAWLLEIEAIAAA